MFLFGSESIDSVVMDNSVFYYHDGSGIKPWVDIYIRKEREDIYIRRGGISVFNKKLLKNEKDIISKKMGHVIVDKISSFEIRSKEDLAIADFIASKLINEKKDV
jgi:CMP-N-acetylneuraminic acid synthetase